MYGMRYAVLRVNIGFLKVAQLGLTLCHPMAYIVHGILQDNTGVGTLSFLQRNFPNPGIKPRSLEHCSEILYQVSTREAQEY